MAEISLTGDQMLIVLETVAQHGSVSAANVARLCGINRTVAHRLLVTLAQRAYVRREAGGYRLGPAVLRLAQSADTDLSHIAGPIMKKLAAETGETVVMHAIDNLEAVVVAQALGEKHLVRVEHRPGSRHVLHQGASGWALLAFQDKKFIDKALGKTVNAEAIHERAEEVRTEGYAISHDELQHGVHGVAAPILERDGRCRYSLAILVPTSRAAALPDIVQPLIAAARRIGAEAG
jgi:DNA-binding IclR family transcriptional regulator